MTLTERATALCAQRWWTYMGIGELWLADGNRSMALECVMLADGFRTAAERLERRRRSEALRELVRESEALGLYEYPFAADVMGYCCGAWRFDANFRRHEREECMARPYGWPNGPEYAWDANGSPL